MTKTSKRLELTRTGKENRSKLEPRICVRSIRLGQQSDTPV